MTEELEAMIPPPPDRKRCTNCKEPMEHDGQPIYAGPPGLLGFMGPPACYVCGRCYYLFREWARSLPNLAK